MSLTIGLLWLFNLSIYNAFVLFIIHHGQQCKKPLLDFRLALAKQLIDGFSQRKRKRHSLDSVNQTAVDPGEHISVHVEWRKRKCVLCIKAGRRTPKGYKVETCFECKLCEVALCPMPQWVPLAVGVNSFELTCWSYNILDWLFTCFVKYL